MPDGFIDRKRPERLRIRPVVLGVYPPGIQICRAYSHKDKPVDTMALSGWCCGYSLCSAFGGVLLPVRPGGNICVYELRVILIPGTPLLPYLGAVTAGTGGHSRRPDIAVAVYIR